MRINIPDPAEAKVGHAALNRHSSSLLLALLAIAVGGCGGPYYGPGYAGPYYGPGYTSSANVVVAVQDRPYYTHGAGYYVGRSYYAWRPGHWSRRHPGVWVPGHYVLVTR
jgi:hypothetical protein